MKNKTVTLSLFGLILSLFLAYFITQHTWFPSGEPIKGHLNNIIQYAQQEKWAEAENSANELSTLWDKGKYLLAVNYAEADYSLFMDNLARIQGAIKTRDDTETVSQALSTLKLWDNFIRVVPQP
ncbi:MAG: DUF4363 family protein [Clostridia bacterium]|nr:DUF4363 family protein [Clostridia bacterium]